MRSTTSVVQENIGLSVTGRVEASGIDPLVWAGFLQVSQEVAVSVQMLSSVAKIMSRRLGNIKKDHQLTSSVGDGVKRLLDVTGNRDGLLLRFSDYELSKKTRA